MEKRAILLIVDDDTECLEFSKGVLGDDFDVRLAKSGKMAMKSLERFRPDLILLDIAMPYMSGFDVLQRLNKHPHFMDIPVIFVTSHATDKLVIQAFENGVVDYVVKPFDASVFRAKIHRALMKRRGIERSVVNTKSSKKTPVINPNDEYELLIVENR